LVTQAAQRFAVHSGDDVAVFEPEPRAFAAALFGAWRAGKCVWLAVDAQPGTREALAAAMAEPLEQRLAPGDRLVLFTSGSTGAPQPIGKSLRQLDAEIAALEQTFGARIGDAAVQGTVSHQHIYGLLFRVLWPLAAGRAFDAPRIEFPEQWATQAGEGDVLVATPSLLASWPPQVAGPRPCLVLSSGGALPVDVAARLAAQFDASVVEVFGSTETGGIAWRAPQNNAGWQPLPGVEWHIEDGQLALRSPHLPDPQAWVRTTDRVEAGEGKDFVLLGRADRIAKVGEKRVSLDGLEARLRETGLVDAVRALVVPGLHRGLAVVAVPTTAGRQRWMAGGRRALSAELRHTLLTPFEPAAVPRHWRFVESLPLNAQGKVTDAALSRLFRPRAPQRTAHEDADDRRVLRLEVPRDLLFFDGHFDAAAVVPGVVLIDWAVAQAAEAFGVAPPLVGIEVLKFQRLVLPGATLSLRLERGADARTIGFAYESVDGSHASGRLRYAAEATA
ncbi:MAG: AMP-binding protein, partial [Silanimonas sp.]